MIAARKRGREKPQTAVLVYERRVKSAVGKTSRQRGKGAGAHRSWKKDAPPISIGAAGLARQTQCLPYAGHYTRGPNCILQYRDNPGYFRRSQNRRPNTATPYGSSRGPSRSYTLPFVACLAGAWSQTPPARRPPREPGKGRWAETLFWKRLSQPPS